MPRLLLLCLALARARHCGDAEIKAKDIKGCTSLKHTRFMGHRGAIWLGHALHHHPHLKVLDLHDTRFGDDDAIAIANGLHNNSHLKRLHLHNNRIYDKGTIALGQALAENDALEFLSLSSNGVGDKGATALAAGLHNNRALRKLDLYFNLIGDAGAKAFAEALKVNTGLRLLHLDTNNIEEAGGLALAEAVEGVRGSLGRSSVAPSSLGELGLSYNPMGNAAAEALMRAAAANPTIHDVGLSQVGGLHGETERRMKHEHTQAMKERHAVAKFIVDHELMEGAGHSADIGDDKRWHGGWHSASGPPLSSPLAPVVRQLSLHRREGLLALRHLSRESLLAHEALAPLPPTTREALVSVLVAKIAKVAAKDEV